MSRNGVDAGQIYAMLRSVTEAQAALESRLQSGFARIHQDIAELRHGQAELRHGQAEMRKEVAFCHASVVGHGITVDQLESRLKRVEDHLGLAPIA